MAVLEKVGTHQVNLRLMAHVPFQLGGWVNVLLERQDTIDVVSPQPVDYRLDGLERPLVQDQVSLQDVH